MTDSRSENEKEKVNDICKEGMVSRGVQNAALRVKFTGLEGPRCPVKKAKGVL